MDAKITPEQRAALQAHPDGPIPIFDDETCRTYYLIGEAPLLHMQGLVKQQDRQGHEQLQALIQEGIDSPHLPASQVFAELRALAEDLCRADA